MQISSAAALETAPKIPALDSQELFVPETAPAVTVQTGFLQTSRLKRDASLDQALSIDRESLGLVLAAAASPPSRPGVLTATNMFTERSYLEQPFTQTSKPVRNYHLSWQRSSSRTIRAPGSRVCRARWLARDPLKHSQGVTSHRNPAGRWHPRGTGDLWEPLTRTWSLG